MINHTALKLPNVMWEVEPLVYPQAPEQGTTVSAYTKARQAEGERRPTSDELRVGGATSEAGYASEAPADSQRVGESASPFPCWWS